MKKFNSYSFRCGALKLSKKETKLMNILMEFGESIDKQGYDSGDYDTAIEKLFLMIERD